MYINQALSSFTQGEIAAALQIWNRAAISLLDIRHNLIAPGEALRGYRLPASTFLYATGKADISLNHIPHHVERFGLFHGGKGTVLDVQPKSDWLEYYMVLYKAGEPNFHRREYAKMLEQTNPFHQQYGFAPDNPVFLWELLRRMFEAWKQPTPLDRFYEKASFYQLVYETYKALESGKINVLQPDAVEMAMRYLDEHFDKAIAIQDVCDMLGVSYSHFHRSFKKRTGSGPQEYLINVRIAQAKRLLKSGCASIPNIAEYCGFMDERNFRRSFLKNTGRTPNTYREELPAPAQDYALGNLAAFPYNENGKVSLSELKGKGASFMFRQMKGKAIVAAALSLMLLMSACGTAPVNSNGVDSTPTASVTSQVKAEPETRVVSTPLGNVEIPANPERVACHTWTGDLVALGVIPVVSNDAKMTVYQDELQDTSHASFIEPEEVMAQNPDLIIVRPATYAGGGKVVAEDYEKIAPTIVMPYDISLDERITYFGEIFNKQEEAKTVLADFYAKAERYSADFKTAGIYGKSLAIVRPTDESLTVLGEDYGHGAQVLYNMLGFKMPDSIQTALKGEGNASMSVSWEVAADFLNADYLEVGLWSEGESVESLTENNSIWDTIPAVQNKNIIEFVNANYDSKSLYVMDKLLDYYHEQFLQSAEQ